MHRSSRNSVGENQDIEPAYAELHCLSNFSFLRGASHPEQLVARASALGYSALAVTDECSVAGVVRAHVAARQHSIKLIIGAEFILTDGLKLVLLAANRNGYGNLCTLITRARRRCRKACYQITAEDLENGVPDCLALLIPEPIFTRTAQRFTAMVRGESGTQFATLQQLASLFAQRTWLAVELCLSGGDRERLATLRTLGNLLELPLVACGDVHMHSRSCRALQDTLTAIRLGTTVTEAGHALFPNAERHLRSRQRLARLYPPDLLAETIAIAARCDFSLDELRYEYPEELVPDGETPSSHLRHLTEAGLRNRYPHGVSTKVRNLIERELNLIAELKYEAFFLTVRDIVVFARSRGILCQGRGSAANSAVCYALGITAIDPTRMDMLFERFISRERDEPPDIDVDFEHDRREEVLQYIYDKYGRERAALAATVITYKTRSAIRDVGKALGLEAAKVNALTRHLAWWDDRNALPERLRERGLDPRHPQMQQLVQLVSKIIGFPHHLSQHVGGMVIARDHLARLVPIENAAMASRTVIQWDKDDLEALGLLKVDVLALGMLSAIHRAFDLIDKHRGRRYTMDNIPPKDAHTYAMIQRADTIGVFQIESRAQMAMLPRLKPTKFYDLVIEIAIVRPGPIQGKMVHPYLRRRDGLEPVDYPSDAVRTVLERTLGVPLFQEQVIQLATVAAGFTPGEADHLRRSMAAWRRNGSVEQFRHRLIDGMRKNHYSEEFAERIYQQILGFGEYGFPESHSASFALIAYVSAWLKCHQPAAFTCALLNSQPMGFYVPSQLVQDASRHGVQVHPVDVNASEWDCTLEEVKGNGVGVNFRGGQFTPTPFPSHPFSIRLGMRMVKGLSQTAAERISAARQQQPFRDIADLARRAQLNAGDIKALAASDACATLTGNRRQAQWQALGIEEPLPLFPDPQTNEATPLLIPPREGEEIIADYSRVGLSLRRHPLALLRPRLRDLHCLSSEDLRRQSNGQRIITGGIVTSRQRPGTASGVVFLTLEDEFGQINVIVWRRLVERYRRAVVGAYLLVVEGEIQCKDEVLHIVAHRLHDQSALIGALPLHSRDFH